MTISIVPHLKKHTIEVAILNYPGAMLSAIHGLKDLFLLTNKICHLNNLQQRFSVSLYDNSTIKKTMTDFELDQKLSLLQIILVPPNLNGDYYLSPEQTLKFWIMEHHAQGSIVCSVCAGAFILASCGLLQNRTVTTHWKLTSQFSKNYPDVFIDSNKILINEGDIITAAGLMSWVDLGLELVAQFIHPSVMRELGKNLVVDTARREQRYYQSFYPILDHGDTTILKVQHYLQKHFNEPITITKLAELGFLSTRTLLRRFVKATNHKPTHYIQRLRIQKACDLIETSNQTFESIAQKVGYEDTSAFRKMFLKIVGLTPRNFKNRFSNK